MYRTLDGLSLSIEYHGTTKCTRLQIAVLRMTPFPRVVTSVHSRENVLRIEEYITARAVRIGIAIERGRGGRRVSLCERGLPMSLFCLFMSSFFGNSNCDFSIFRFFNFDFSIFQF